ncbi:MAG: DUF4249 family protein [Chitinophagales bacterium]
MMRNILLNVLIGLLIVSCIDPKNIPLGTSSEWVVFGLMGEDKEPVIFVYGVEREFGRLIYNKEALITITNQNSGEISTLESVVNDTSKYYKTNEFPFATDLRGDFIYYSSNSFKAQTGINYEIEIDLGNEKGKSLVVLPSRERFSSVELVNNGIVNQNILMSIENPDTNSYYKWDVSIDQSFSYDTPFIDSINGDTNYISENLVLRETYTPNIYISKNRIEESENSFVFNIVQNIGYYPNIEEPFYLNVRLRHYGKEVVDYFESINRQNEISSFDPFVEPVFIKSNIDGLIGLVGTFTYSNDLLLEYQP